MARRRVRTTRHRFRDIRARSSTSPSRCPTVRRAVDSARRSAGWVRASCDGLAPCLLIGAPASSFPQRTSRHGRRRRLRLLPRRARRGGHRRRRRRRRRAPSRCPSAGRRRSRAVLARPQQIGRCPRRGRVIRLRCSRRLPTRAPRPRGWSAIRCSGRGVLRVPCRWWCDHPDQRRGVRGQPAGTRCRGCRNRTARHRRR